MSDLVRAVTDATFEEIVLKANGPVLVDFWAEWCHPCRMLTPVVEEVAQERGHQLTICKVNIDENQKTPATYGVRSIPTLLLFKDSNIVATSVGALSKSQLLTFIDDHIAS